MVHNIELSERCEAIITEDIFAFFLQFAFDHLLRAHAARLSREVDEDWNVVVLV